MAQVASIQLIPKETVDNLPEVVQGRIDPIRLDGRLTAEKEAAPKTRQHQF